MAEKISAVNPKMLVWAREVSGTSLLEAGLKFGENKLTAWENGTEHPTYAELKNIGNYYRKPIAVFFFPEPPVNKDIPASCRTLPVETNVVFNRNITKMVDWARTMQINLYELYGQENPAISKFKNYRFDSSDLKKAAQQLRSLLGVDIAKQKRFANRQAAFEYWRERLFSIGIYVLKTHLRTPLYRDFAYM